MGKINLLDSSVFNRIAAGEVVERPCSIVKELVENSIDSGADTVIVEIKRGGIDMIRVVDNGCGMEADDLEKAFLPHATSKIKTIDNLDAITTLGFRGEALTSIASVAKVTLISRTHDSEIGNYVVIENGNILEKGEKGCSCGTTVIVEDLFKNVPARAKFLAKPSTEESVISDMVSRLIMANYIKSINYIADGKTVFQSAGDNLKNAVYSVYGKTFIDNMMPISSVMSDITLGGFINKPYFTKPNRTYQTLIVNGRYVNNADISFCVYNCYKDFLMKRQYPAYVLTLDLPPNMLDINVHPNKLEVKFADSDSVKRIVYNAVKNLVAEMMTVPKEISITQDDSRPSQEQVFIRRHDVSQLEEISRENQTPLGTFFTVSPSEKPQPAIKSPNPSSTPNYDMFHFPADETKTAATPILADSHKDDTMPSAEQATQVSFTEIIPTIHNEALLSEYKIKTVLFDTYITLEQGNDVFLIDQHAAHERLLYDKLTAQLEKQQVQSQDMLIPHVFTVTPIESNLINERLDAINSCGFALTSLGGSTFSLSAVPLICSDMEIRQFISMILDGLNRMKYKKTDFIKDILMQSACKAAVKGEDKLSEGEIDYLIRQFKNGNTVLTCPHGRPLIIKISRSEIEKWFKRVV